jgi:hypothetical protein
VDSGLGVSYWAQGGADGNVYKITFAVTTSFTQTVEDEIIITIREE